MESSPPKVSRTTEASSPRTAIIQSSSLSTLQKRLKSILMDEVFHKVTVRDVQIHLSLKRTFIVTFDQNRSVLVRSSPILARALANSEMSEIELNFETENEMEACAEMLVLMNYENEKHFKRIRRADVTRILGLLKASNAMEFKEGIISCLDYLEAVPWEEDDMQTIVSALKDLEAHNWMVDIVLQRVPATPQITDSVPPLFFNLLEAVLKSKHPSVLTKMRTVMSELLIHVREMAQPGEDALFHDLNVMLCSLVDPLITACTQEVNQMGDNDNGISNVDPIQSGCDSILLLFEIMVTADMGNILADVWAEQHDLEEQYNKLESSKRYPITLITSYIFTAIGNGLILVKMDSKYNLLRTWLPGLYTDFGLLRNISGFNVEEVEVGLAKTFLTLSSDHQKEYFLQWFSNYVTLGDDCPDLSLTFLKWWRIKSVSV
ncbi:hypothetical protein BVC80_1835g626 [Macleaya cordata]|uniref:At3g05675-like ankyrin-like domain-containing protein n=1 Tax=Macleaya cordata TaxID=56857 RepID=A0A200R653_MACCD|nr:hypothetical protein BVC80_1835g626 [Macleaya cordata]